MLIYFHFFGLILVALCDDTSSLLFVFGDLWNPGEVDISYFQDSRFKKTLFILREIVVQQ